MKNKRVKSKIFYYDFLVKSRKGEMKPALETFLWVVFFVLLGLALSKIIKTVIN